MAVFTETKKPYELLVRWDKDGNIAGAHVGFIERTLKDGVEIASRVCDVMPVGIGAAAGFPLADILETVLIDALTSRDIAIAQKQAAVDALEEVKSKQVELE